MKYVSERLIGEVIEGRREEWLVATKFGHRCKGDFERELWSADEVRRSDPGGLQPGSTIRRRWQTPQVRFHEGTPHLDEGCADAHHGGAKVHASVPCRRERKTSVLTGRDIRLRLLQEADLPEMYRFHLDIANRGEFFPTGVVSFGALQSGFRESGFWSDTKGILALVNATDELLGHIEYFETVSYLDEFELSYILYSAKHHGRGYATEAVDLLTRYLFDRKKLNRIRLVIHPNNGPSKRVAEKAGYTFEGISRGAWFHRGANHDVEIWSILRADSDRRRHAGGGA